MNGYINVELSETLVKLLVPRFRHYLLEGKFYIFGSQICKNTPFCQSLIHNAVLSSGESPDKERKMLDVNGKDHCGFSILMNAVGNGNGTAARILVAKGANVNQQDHRGETAVHHLCKRHFPEIDIIQLLIEHGADMTQATHFGNTALHFLCMRRYPNVKVMKLLLEAGVDVNYVNKNGNTALHQLSQCSDESNLNHLLRLRGESTENHLSSLGYTSNVNHFQLLLDYGASLNIRNLCGYSPLLFVTGKTRPDLNVVKLLLEAGADVNSKVFQTGNTPLHEICWTGKSVEVLKLLIEHGASVDMVNKTLDTPLHSWCSSYHRSFSMVKVLLESNVDVNKQDLHGKTALHCIFLDQYRPTKSDVTKLLLSHGADVNISDKHGQTVLHYLCKKHSPGSDNVKMILERDSDINKGDENGCTGLHWLCKSRVPDLGLLQSLVEFGVDVNRTNKDGQTALHILCVTQLLGSLTVYGFNLLEDKPDDIEQEHAITYIGREEGKSNYETAKYLISCGASVNVEDKALRTPLHVVCGSGHQYLQMVELLCKNKADVIKQDTDGKTPLHELLSPLKRVNETRQDADVLKLLLSHGGDVNIADKRGQKAIHYICQKTDPDPATVKMVLESDADINKGDEDGSTGLHLLCKTRTPDLGLLQSLLAQGAKVNQQDVNGKTAIHNILDPDKDLHPEGQEEIEVLEVLLSHGGDVNISDKDGQRMLHYLCRRHSPDPVIVKMVLGRDSNVNEGDNNGWTGLHWLCGTDAPDLGLLQTLLDHGAMVNKIGGQSQTALHVLFAPEEKALDILTVVSMILNHGANVNLLDDLDNSALHYLCNSNSDAALAKLLLDKDADVNAKNANGQTCLILLCNNVYPDMNLCKLLLEHEVDVNAQATNSDGFTALHTLSVIEPHFEGIRLLAEHGAELDCMSKDGKSALRILCENEKQDVEVIKYLIECGTDVTGVSTDGKTPLHSLCRNKEVKSETIKCFLDHGADIHTEDMDGQSSFQILKEVHMENLELMEFLKEL